MAFYVQMTVYYHKIQIIVVNLHGHIMFIEMLSHLKTSIAYTAAGVAMVVEAKRRRWHSTSRTASKFAVKLIREKKTTFSH